MISEDRQSASSAKARRICLLCAASRIEIRPGREYERDCAKHRIVEVRADTIGKLDRAEPKASLTRAMLRC